MLDVGDILGITELFVVIDAPNRRLVRTLVDEIEEAVRERPAARRGGSRACSEQQWVLIDYGDVVVHVFLDEIRRFYEIERLYRDAPVVAVGLTAAGILRSRSAATDRYVPTPVRGCSSVGRALPWHGRGQGFDSPQLHHLVQGPRPQPAGRVVISTATSSST